jgi:phospholipase C
MRKRPNLVALSCIALLLGACHDDDKPTPTPTPTASPTPTPSSSPTPTPTPSQEDSAETATPIKHLVVIFDENESFDHYFGTYPTAANPNGEPMFTATADTPEVNGYNRDKALLTDNPNTRNADNLATGIAAAQMNPFRLDRAQFDTASQNHAYTAEQKASDNGKMDAFVANTGRGSAGGAGAFGTAAQVMGYFDGNTVTALWNYAQHFAMSDNAFTDSFGPSTPGALNVVAGTTAGASAAVGGSIADGQGGYTVTGDPDPEGDVCSSTKANSTLHMLGKNIGDLLNAAGISWGGFMGGFDLTLTNKNGTTNCQRSTVSPNTSRTVTDYSPHHAWFQYYPSTANLKHTRPSSVDMIGHTEPELDKTDAPVHHQYDLEDFYAAVKAGNYPSVSYIKMSAYQDAHPGNSNPLDEQAGVAKLINFLQQQPDWKNTAVIITYDDSDGWYDHQAPNVLNASSDPDADQLNGAGKCTGPDAKPAVGINGKTVNGRCGPGSRIPFLVISPYAKVNYVSHTGITQASVVRFIEDNWLRGERIGGGSDDATTGSIMDLFDFKAEPRLTPLYLDPLSGMQLASPPSA